MVAVRSSNVARIGHDGHDLRVDFHNGGRYRYVGVPVRLYNELLHADSVGTLLHQKVKGKFDTVKL